jgi:hypothetical protein
MRSDTRQEGNPRAKRMRWTDAIHLALMIVIISALSWGCARFEKGAKHWESAWRGLDRTITVYTDDGRLFQQWKAKAYVEVKHGTVAFIDSAGKETKISGGILVIRER